MSDYPCEESYDFYYKPHPVGPLSPFVLNLLHSLTHVKDTTEQPTPNPSHKDEGFQHYIRSSPVYDHAKHVFEHESQQMTCHYPHGKNIGFLHPFRFVEQLTQLFPDKATVIEKLFVSCFVIGADEELAIHDPQPLEHYPSITEMKQDICTGLMFKSTTDMAYYLGQNIPLADTAAKATAKLTRTVENMMLWAQQDGSHYRFGPTQ